MNRRAARRGWSHSVASGGWGESTHAELAWDKSRSAGTRWAVAGAVCSACWPGWSPSRRPPGWPAASRPPTNQRAAAADARGTVWSGSAVPVLTGGPDSRDASALPGRIEWTAGLQGLAFELRARHSCCLNNTISLTFQPGLGRARSSWCPPPGGWIGQWPSAWLTGLGTPFNTLQLRGALRLSTPGVLLESAEGRWRMQGRIDSRWSARRRACRRSTRWAATA
jgi:general secretion pathway protein N